MEEWQKEYITRYGPNLIHDTIVEPLLLYLRSSGVLSNHDMQDVESKDTQYQQSKRLYEILETRTNAFEVLVQALYESKQTGAADRLKRAYIVYGIPVPESLRGYKQNYFRQGIQTENRLVELPLAAETGETTEDESRSYSLADERDVPTQSQPNTNHIKKTKKSIYKWFENLEKAPYYYGLEFGNKFVNKIISTSDVYITVKRLLEIMPVEVEVFATSYPVGFLKGNDTIKSTTIVLVVAHLDEPLSNLLRDLETLMFPLKVIISTKDEEDDIQATVRQRKNFKTLYEIESETLCWNDLTSQFQNKLLRRQVRFQNARLKLEQIVSVQNHIQDLDQPTLIKLIRNFMSNQKNDEIPLICNKTAMEPKESYEKRELSSRRSLEESCLINVQGKGIVFIDNIEIEQITAIKNRLKLDVQIEYGSYVSHQNNQARIVIPDSLFLSNRHYKWLCDCTQETVYRLRKSDSGPFFEFIESRKGIQSSDPQALILRSAKPNQSTGIREIDMTSHAESMGMNGMAVCIAGSPGIGKTSLLHSLANRIMRDYPTRFVQYYNMSELMYSLTNLKEDEDIPKEELLKAIADKSMTTEFGKRLLKSWLFPKDADNNNIQCELMIDGIDDVLQSNLDAALFILRQINRQTKNTRIWVTLRTPTIGRVEKAFNTIGYILNPLPFKNQVRFLMSFWIKMHSEIDRQNLRKFAIRCLNTIIEKLPHKDEYDNNMLTSPSFGFEMTGNPLQVSLIAEAYSGEDLKYSKDPTTSIAKLFSKIVKKKLEIYMERQGLNNTNLENSDRGVYRTCENEMDLLHAKLAIEKFFGQTTTENNNTPSVSKSLYAHFKTLRKFTRREITDFGIVSSISENRTANFVHNTYGEYFIARFITEHGFFSTEDGDSESSKMMHSTLAKFFVKNVLSVTYLDNEKTRGPYFHNTVIPYLIDSILQFSTNKQASKPFLAAVGKVWQEERHEMPEKFIAAIMNDHTHILEKLFNGSQSTGKHHEKFLKHTSKLHKDMIYRASAYSSIGCLRKLCEILRYGNTKEKKNKRTIADLFLEDDKQDEKIPLHAALARGNKAIVNYLVNDQGFEPSTWPKCRKKSSRKFSLLHVVLEDSWQDSEVVTEEKKKIIRSLVQKDKWLLNVKDDYGRPPLLQEDASIALLQFLVSEGVNVYVADDKQGNTILHMICSTTNSQLFDNYYNQINADSYEVNEVGTLKRAKRYQAAYEHVMKNEEEGIYDGIVSASRSPANNRNSRPVDSNNNFISVPQEESRQSVSSSSSNGSSSRAQIRRGLPLPLDDALKHELLSAYRFAKSIEFMHFLINLMKMNPEWNWNRENNIGTTPLHVATAYGNLEAIKLFVETHNAGVNVPDKHGRRPLHYVTLEGKPASTQIPIIEYLVAHGAQLSFAGHESPLLYALREGVPDKDIIKTLDTVEQMKEKLFFLHKKDYNAMLHALFKNNRVDFPDENFHDIFIYLITSEENEGRADVSYVEKGFTILHHAAKNLSLEKMKNLEIYIKRGQLNINKLDANGNTPLDLAIESKSIVGEAMARDKVKYLKAKDALLSSNLHNGNGQQNGRLTGRSAGEGYSPRKFRLRDLFC